jgi:hypothetical protein
MVHHCEEIVFTIEEQPKGKVKPGSIAKRIKANRWVLFAETHPGTAA